MRQINEIADIINDNGYTIHSIIMDTLGKFKMKTLCHRTGIVKKAGHEAFNILALLLILPLLALKSVNQFLGSTYSGLAAMKKDTLYRFKNNERFPWRSLLMAVAKTFRQLAASGTGQQNDSVITAFILDDTLEKCTGRIMEGVTRVFDHVIRKSVLGFKNLMLAFYDGTSTIPIDFSLHAEKKLKRVKARPQYKKGVDPRSAGGKRRKELNKNKIDQGLAMIRRAVKHGFIAKYVLCDSWFTSLDFVRGIRSIKNGAMHIIAGIRADKRTYSHKGELFTAKALIEKCKATKSEKRCRKLGIRYFEAIVGYKCVGDVKLMICRYPGQKKWRVFISTDTTLPFVQLMEIYGIRWTIEVMFKEMKQYLQLGKCQSKVFDAQIADATISSVLYVLLAYVKRVESYETIGKLCQCIGDDMREKTLAERLWALFIEILTFVIDTVVSAGDLELSKFKQTKEFQMINDIFASSFLSNQLQELSKKA